jgi:A/G-specific adenine glycosylase
MQATLRKSLCRWFERNARDLPWRTRPTGYRVWVSEIMLQQTRVEAVREKYIAFLRRFSTVRALADADIEEVLQAWSGLGYYRRARQLHAAAREIVKNHGGRVPSDATKLINLPGIGRYTAGAISSIAFNQPAPIVDGNVQRVIARWHCIADPTANAARETWDLARRWVEDGAVEGHEPRVLNQALMELGATVCTPRKPQCGTCSATRECGAHKQGNPLAFPAAKNAPAKKRVRYLLVAARDKGGRILLTRRDEHDRATLLPAGLWELPHAPWNGGTRPFGEIRTQMGDFTLCGKSATIRHSITDHDVHLCVQPATLVGTSAAGRWFTMKQALDAAIASATRKALQQVASPSRPMLRG